jgi:hypothetical protein
MIKSKLDVWNPWTYKSSNVQFKSKKKYIGDGEEKLGKEFNTQPLGQNMSYDLKVGREKWEVKKLDTDNSFRLGVSVSSNYINLQYKLINCFSNLDKVKDQLLSRFFRKKIFNVINQINSSFGSSRTSILEGLLKNELSEANLIKLNELIEELKEIINFNHQEIEMYSSFDGKKHKYSSIDAMKKIKLEVLSKDKLIKTFGNEDFFDQNFICSVICDDLDILENKTFKEALDETVRGVFDDLRFVIVDKQKGYLPLSTLDKISCYRITSGNPRCKINLD